MGDYAEYLKCLIRLFEITGKEYYIDKANTLIELVDEYFKAHLLENKLLQKQVIE